MNNPTPPNSLPEWQQQINDVRLEIRDVRDSLVRWMVGLILPIYVLQAGVLLALLLKR